MDIHRATKRSRDYPEVLKTISGPPKELFFAGPLSDLLQRPRVAIVGSRRVTPYGRQVTLDLAERLAEQGIVIISGLALGVDGLAHQAALEVNGLTIAVLPGPVEEIVPASHQRLAEAILAKDGVLVSEYAQGIPPLKSNFVARNRLVAGLAQAVIITEASEKSGSLHTARFALEQGKEVLAVPGNITSSFSIGANNLLKAGAMPCVDYRDVLHILGLYGHDAPLRLIRGHSPEEQTVLDLLLRGLSDGQVLLEESGLSVTDFNHTLTMLEINGQVRPLGANHWALR
ncbi:MAG TPA: DNA-processing protein DprA [Candidatus Saccharimonadales bacterium]|nr:DNA-processing protein DprA [Candidatus Saccharimonadales bacterium]